MKALSVLGTASGVGKTWMGTALCAWLHRQGVKVAPFKSQNMSNNAWVTLDGGEMARAQAVQAEACGLPPSVRMNPILLKPESEQESQLVVLGKALAGHQSGENYYAKGEWLWEVVVECLEFWRSRCEVLLLEGAGSPVELNLLSRDMVNFRPLRYLDGRWLLVGDIDKGGIYAQLAGTWLLTPAEDRTKCLGAVVNRFRGDLSLFPDPQRWLAPYAPGLPVLGTLPWSGGLQPDEEDGLAASDEMRGKGELIAWLRLPFAANLTDCQPWWEDEGVCIRWVDKPELLSRARVIVIPGSKNTLADLRWLRDCGLAEALMAAAGRGVLIIGLCGGFQMLGEWLSDEEGVAGDAGIIPGMGLLPLKTVFERQKTVRQVIATSGTESWTAYEIHMGRSTLGTGCEALHRVRDENGERPEGARCGNVWGTYLHGWFESPSVRRQVARFAGISGHCPASEHYADRRRRIYDRMADHIERHLDLSGIRRYLGI